jgi:hypothetical protein
MPGLPLCRLEVRADMVFKSDMQRLLSTLLVLLALTASVSAREDWKAMKAGLTPGQAIALLGQPLVQNKGHGYEIWYFDCQGEVTLYRGRVLYWNAPQTTAPIPAAANTAVASATSKPVATAPLLAQDKRPATDSAAERPKA